MSRDPSHILAVPSRREFLYGAGAGLGSVALSSLLQGAAPVSHIESKAKRCIFLMMEGGPSHIDTFDPKPELNRRHLQEFSRKGDMESAMSSGKRYFVRSPFEFSRAGKSGSDICTEWVHLKERVDDICFYRGAQVESVNHPTACFQLNTGNRFGGDPAVGAWVTYGLGSINENLPGFVVLPRASYPQGGAGNWSNGYLPADFQGTPLRPEGSPILDLNPPKGVTRERQRTNLDLLATLNRKHLQTRSDRSELEARMASYELAYRMQMEVPGVLDLKGESPTTLEAYGVGTAKTDAFGRKCLLARRLVEKGVRFVQAYAGNWDNGLRGGGQSYGRDHNAKAMTMWFAGGGTKAGHTVGATDDVGAEAVDCVHHIRDVHVTLLHLLGLDDNRLTYYHAGRHKQLSQFGGQVIKELIA